VRVDLGECQPAVGDGNHEAAFAVDRVVQRHGRRGLYAAFESRDAGA
jgi:hypothetical protein